MPQEHKMNEPFKMSDGLGFTDAQTKLNKSIIYGRPKFKVDIAEFVCPAFDEDDSSAWHTLSVCDGKALGRGCKDKSLCIAYEEQKAIQNRYPDLDWDNPSVINDKMKGIINLVKKKAILNP